MIYSVVLYRSNSSVAASAPEIRTQVEAADPSMACLAVMSQFGLTYAYYVLVYARARCVGEFSEVGLSLQNTSSSATELLAYDYGL